MDMHLINKTNGSEEWMKNDNEIPVIEFSNMKKNEEMIESLVCF